MYNKIFGKILDSSVWLEPTPTRIVWITLLAAMDEDGFCSFAAIGNVAGRARVTVEEAKAALEILSAPDSESSDPDNEGRRIERVSGGWIVLNATKYRDIVSRANAQEKTRERVKRFREKNKSSNDDVTLCNGEDTDGNVLVLSSEAVSESNTEKLLRKVVIQLPATGKKFYEVDEKQVDHWRELFPAINVLQCLRKMVSWLESNPSNKKTIKGMPRFISNWLSREQDRAPRQMTTEQPKPKKQFVALAPTPDNWRLAQVSDMENDS